MAKRPVKRSPSPNLRISQTTGRRYYKPATRMKYSLYLKPESMNLARSAVRVGDETLSDFFERAIASEVAKLERKHGNAMLPLAPGRLRSGPRPGKSAVSPLRRRS